MILLRLIYKSQTSVKRLLIEFVDRCPDTAVNTRLRLAKIINFFTSYLPQFGFHSNRSAQTVRL